MSDAGYDLLFRGEPLPGEDVVTVRANLSRLLKLDAAHLAQMFSGRDAYVRRGADRETAARFQQAFKQAGARLRVIPVEASKAAGVADAAAAATAAAAAAATSTATFAMTARPAGSAVGTRKLSLAERLAAQSEAVAAEAPAAAQKFVADGVVAWGDPAKSGNKAVNLDSKAPAAHVYNSGDGIDYKPPVRGTSPTLGAGAADESSTFELAPLGARAANESPTFELAPLGADMLDEDERAPQATVRVDISHLSLAPNAGVLPTLPNPNAHALALDAPDLGVAALGVDLGITREFIPLAIDLSHLSLAEAGARIGPNQAPFTLEIDLSGLSLAPPGR